MFWNDNSPEKQAMIFIFLIFMLLMMAMAILGAHSRAHAKELSGHKNPKPKVEEILMCLDDSEIQSEEEKLVVQIHAAIRNHLVMCRQGSDGEFLYHLFCREDSYCLDSVKEYARSIVKYSLEFGIDPWWPTAVAMHETHFNAYAKGGRGERTIFQLLPYSDWGRQSFFTQSPKYREKCKTQVGHCQDESIGIAIKLLSVSLKQCKTTAGMLSMYNGGECSKESTKKYIKSVKKGLFELKTLPIRIQWCSGGVI